MTYTDPICSQFQLSLASGGPLKANFPYPNLFCTIVISCSFPSVPSQTFIVTSFSEGCSSANAANTINYQTVNIPNQVYQQGVSAPTVTLNLASLAIISASVCPTQVNIFTKCWLLQTTTGAGYYFQPVSPATSFDSLSFILPTTTASLATDYNYLCNTNCALCKSFFSNTFQITVNPTCTPTIATQPIDSYSNNVLSIALPVALIATGYASTTNPTYCVFSYALFNSNGTPYTGTDVSIDSSTGAVSIISNILFSKSLYIEVTSTYLTISINAISSSTFVVSQVCGTFCTPTIIGIVASYALTVSASSQIVVQSYGTTTNPLNCVLSYSLQDSPGNTSYTGTDINISQTTGIIQTQNLNVFTSTSVQITLTSYYVTLPCSGTTTSSAFMVSTACSGYCTPTIMGISAIVYSFTISNSQQKILQSYASTTNPANCIFTYSIQNNVGNTTYTGSDISISATTGVIQSSNLNIFTTALLQITVTSTYSVYPCSGTVTSPAFTISALCNNFCTPRISGITQPIYNASFVNPQQVILQSYASTSNPTYCVISFSAIYASNSSTYQGSFFTLVTTTGKIIVNASSSFVSDQIIIIVASSCTFASCQGTVSSIPFQINATRSVNCLNVQIQPPLNFEFNKVLSTNGPNFVYSNFTTSSPYCTIQSHTIVHNKTDQNIPTGLLQTIQGSSSFSINVNQQYKNIPNLYDFYIKVETVGGQIFYKEAQIYMDQCGYDQILLNTQMPALSFNKTAGYSYKIDMNSYFTSLYPTYCPLSFQISKVSINNIMIPQQNYSSLFGISGSLIQVYSQTQEIFTNYQIEVKASNNKITCDSSQILQFNASIYLIQEKLINSNNSTQKNLLTESKNQVQKSLSANQNYQNSQINFKYNPFQNQNQLTLKRDNFTGQIIQSVMIKKYSINDNGILTLVLNQNLTVPDFAQTALNLSSNISINQSTYFPQKISTNESLSDLLSLKNIIQFYIIPKSNIDKTFMKFESKLTQWDSQGIQIQLNFTYPQIISQGKIFDQLAFQILNGSNFTSNQSKSNYLNTYYNGFYKVDIPPQSLVLQQNTKKIVSTIQGSTTSVIIVQVFIQYLMKKSITPNQKLLLNLQMQISLSYFQVILPYQAQFYLNIVKSVIDFSIQKILQSLGLQLNLQEIFKAQENASALPVNLQ